MSTDIIARDTSLANWQVMTQQATMLVKSGFLPQSIKTAEQAVAIMLTGQELGIPTMVSLRKINVIQGTPAIAPELMLALCITRVKGFTFKWGDCGPTSATFICSRPGMADPYTSTYTMEDAKKAGLAGKDNYTKHGPNMLRWRALGNAVHATCPDVVAGLYTPDELGVETDEAGEIIDLNALETPVLDAVTLPTDQPTELATVEQKAKLKTCLTDMFNGNLKAYNEAVSAAAHRPCGKNDLPLTKDEADAVLEAFGAVEPVSQSEAEPADAGDPFRDE